MAFSGGKSRPTQDSRAKLMSEAIFVTADCNCYLGFGFVLATTCHYDQRLQCTCASQRMIAEWYRHQNHSVRQFTNGYSTRIITNGHTTRVNPNGHTTRINPQNGHTTRITYRGQQKKDSTTSFYVSLPVRSPPRAPVRGPLRAPERCAR